MKRTKPDAGEPVTVTSEDRNVAMSVAYKLAVQDVTHDDQYRHEAAKIVALHRQQAVAEATAELRAELLAAQSKLAALEKENAALREDKERLDWLSTESASEWAYNIMDHWDSITREALDDARAKEIAYAALQPSAKGGTKT